MSFHIFTQSSIVPSTFTVNIRNVLDSAGPHLLTFGCRTVVAGNPSNLTMSVRYENPNGEIQTLFLPAPIDLSDTTQAGGGIWYRDVVETIDQYWPLSNGPNSEETRGVFAIDFTLSGTPAAARFTYEAILQYFDGGSAVTYHP